MNEGDLNSDAPGSCARDNGGKVTFSALPLHLLAGAARVMMFGRMKYAAWNWAKGGLWSTPFDCAIRHMLKWWFLKEENDAESGLHHIDHAICNLLFIRHFILSHREGDDRPPKSAMFNDEHADFLNMRHIGPRPITKAFETYDHELPSV